MTSSNNILMIQAILALYLRSQRGFFADFWLSKIKSSSLVKLGIITACLSVATAHACTLPKSYYKHVSCTSAQGVFLAVRDNGTPVALLNRQGTKTADLFAYDAVLASHFRHGLLPVRQGRRVGYINAQGRVVIPIIYDSLGGSQWARAANNERIVVKKSGKFGVIDTQNRTIIAFDDTITNISDYQNSRATITHASGSYSVDKQGRQVTQDSLPSDDELLWIDGNEGSEPIFTPILQNGKWGFADSRNVVVIMPVFDEVRFYHMGLAGVRQGTHWGFINKAGQLVIDFRFDDAGIIKDSTDAMHLPEPFVFINGKAWIGNLNDGTKLCIDTQGVNISC